MFRKFFEMDAPTVTSAPSAPSIAELMATKGVVNNSSEPIAQAIEFPAEKQEQSSQASEAPVVTTTASNAEQVFSESPAPTATTQVTPATIVPEQPKLPSWQEVLKSQQPDEVFKELGYSDNLVKTLNIIKDSPQMQAFLEHWANNGDTVAYLKEANTDYAKMPAEEVMRHQLRKDYPKATEAQINVLYRKEVIEAYGLDSDDQEELENGRMLLEAKAERFRDELVANQQKYLLPKAPEPKAVVADPKELEQQREAEQFVQRYHTQVNEHPFIKEVFSSNTFTIGEGDDKFTFPVDAKAVRDILFDENRMAETQFEIEYNADGSIKTANPKVEHQFLTAMVAKYGKAFLDSYAKHLLAKGGQKAIAPIENAKQPDNKTSASEVMPNDPVAAMAKHGRLV